MEVRKTIEIAVRYNIPDEVSDIDFTRVENFGNFNFDKSVVIDSVKESKVNMAGVIKISINETEEMALKEFDCGDKSALKPSQLKNLIGRICLQLNKEI